MQVANILERPDHPRKELCKEVNEKIDVPEGILGPIVFRFFSFFLDRSRSAKLIVRFSPDILLLLLLLLLLLILLLLFDEDETNEDPPLNKLLLLPLNEMKSPFILAGADARRSNVFKKLNFCFVLLLLLLLLTVVVADKLVSMTADAAEDDDDDEPSADEDFGVVLGVR